MEKAIRNKAFRSGLVWFVAAAVAATGLIYLVQRTVVADPENGPRGLGDIELLATTSTITLGTQGSTTGPALTLRASVGPTGCKDARQVTLFKQGVGSAADVPVQTLNTGSSGNVDFTVVKSAATAGVYYADVAADPVQDCSGATSNTVTVPAS